MPKLEHGQGILVSVDTDKKTIRFKEFGGPLVSGQTHKEWELPNDLNWAEKDYFQLLGKKLEYVISDGKVVDLTYLKS